MNRRDFLGGVPLIGTTLSANAYQPRKVAALKGAAKSVVIPTHEFAGNLDERLDFPADWEVNVMDMRGRNAPVLKSVEIRRGLDKPIGTKSLREIAEGKKTVAITFDDLTRATPTFTVTPWVIEQLKAAGIADENILFIGSFATHRPMTAIEVQAKLGRDIARRFPG